MSVKLWIKDEMFLVDDAVRDEFERLAAEVERLKTEIEAKEYLLQSMTVSATGYGAKVADLKAENAALRKRCEELEAKKEQYLKMIANFTGNA